MPTTEGQGISLPVVVRDICQIESQLAKIIQWMIQIERAVGIDPTDDIVGELPPPKTATKADVRSKHDANKKLWDSLSPATPTDLNDRLAKIEAWIKPFMCRPWTAPVPVISDKPLWIPPAAPGSECCPLCKMHWYRASGDMGPCPRCGGTGRYLGMPGDPCPKCSAAKKPFILEIEKLVSEKMGWIARHRERLIEAFVAETGVLPSEATLVEQERDGKIYVWIEQNKQAKKGDVE